MLVISANIRRFFNASSLLMISKVQLKWATFRYFYYLELYQRTAKNCKVQETQLSGLLLIDGKALISFLG